MNNTYAITGATGNIGHVIVEELLKQGHKVRAIGRSKERLQPLVDKGAEAWVGSLDDTEFLTRAYRGTDGVFAMIPPDMRSDDFRTYQNRIARSHIEAIRESKVDYVVALSSIGAHLKEGSGVVLGLHDFETHLRTLGGVDLLVLRPSYFMENVYSQLDIIKNMGVAGTPVGANVSQPVVATRDIGKVAADRLSDLSPSGHNVEYILGPKNLTYAEITRAIGEAIGKPDLKYVQFPGDEASKAMVQMGMSENTAKLIVELSDGINNGKVLEGYERTPENTTPTSIDEFAQWFAKAYQSA